MKHPAMIKILLFVTLLAGRIAYAQTGETPDLASGENPQIEITDPQAPSDAELVIAAEEASAVATDVDAAHADAAETVGSIVVTEPEPVVVDTNLPAETEQGRIQVDTNLPAESESVVVDTSLPAEPVIVKQPIQGRPPESASHIDAAPSARKITISLPDVTLSQAVEMFEKTANANIISDPNMLTGALVRATLTDAEWQPALRSILEMHGLTLDERTQGSGVYTIRRRSSEGPEPTQVKTYFLDYTTADEVGDPVRQILPPGRTNEIKSINFHSRNALVVRSTEKSIGEIDQLIGNIDRPAKQVLVEVKIMELSDDASKQLGIRWDALESLEIRALGGASYDKSSEDVDDRGSSDIRTATRNQTRTRTDNAGNSSASSSSLVFPGIFNSSDSSSSSRTRADNNSLTESDISSRSESALSDFTETISKQQSAILELSELSLVLSALEKINGVSIVSNPKMIVTSGSTQNYFRVGDRYPIVTTSIERGTPDSPGDTITYELDSSTSNSFIRSGYAEMGIEIQVMATIKTDDYIETKIQPSLRRILNEEEFFSAEVSERNPYPIVSVKEFGTAFTLRSGQTVAIGGLTDTQDAKETTRIPILGSIPVIGRLFSHTRDVKRQVETIIFVTMSVADPVNLSREAGIPQDSALVHQRLKAEDALAEAAKAEGAAEKKEEKPRKKRSRK